VADTSFDGTGDLQARAAWSVGLSRSRGLGNPDLLVQLLGHCRLDRVTPEAFAAAVDVANVQRAGADDRQLAEMLLAVLTDAAA
jgi:hypothetical protein